MPEDPIEELNSLVPAMQSTPPDPADIRRRGDQRRRRRRAVVAAGAAAAVVAIVVPVALLNQPDNDIEPAPPPTPTIVPEPEATITEADLMTDDDTVFHAPADGESDWFSVETDEGEPDDGVTPCARQALTDLGAIGALNRGYELRTPGAPSESYNTLTETVAEFDDDAAARQAVTTLSDQIADCEGQIPQIDRYDAGTPTEIDPGTPGRAETSVAIYGPVPKSIDEFGDMGYFTETGLIQSGNRIAVITQTIVGQDYSWPDGTPVARMIPPAAQRLQSEAANDPEPSDRPDPTDVPDAGGTDLTTRHVVAAATLPTVPQTDGWSPMPGQSEAPVMACADDPLTAFNAQGRRADFAAVASGTSDEIGHVRLKILQFESETVADGAYAELEGWLARCPAGETDEDVSVQEPIHDVTIGTGRTAPERARQAMVTYTPPAVAAEGGEGSWWDHLTVAQRGNRVVVASYAEFAGACGPITGDELNCEDESLRQPWLDRVDEATTAIVAQAFYDLG